MTCSRTTLIRALALWVSISTALVLVLRLLLPTLTALPRGRDAEAVADALVALCTTLLLGCALWAWLVTSVVVAEALGARGPAGGVPAPVRRVLLAACGIALAGGLAAPAAADTPGPGLDGLPLPDRAVGPATAPAPAATDPVVVVRPGDSLWRLAEASLPAGASPAVVAAQTDVLYRHNRRLIGADPDLVLPGQRLRLPADRPASPPRPTEESR